LGRRLRRGLRGLIIAVAAVVLGFYCCCILELAALRWANPPTTTLQVQRRVAAWLHHQALS
jgi:hypothetical protein